MRRIACAVVLLLCSLPLRPARADELRSSTQPPSPWRIGVALGYGRRTNPLIQSDDIPVAVDLDIAWFGKRFYFDNGDAGFTVVDNDKITASVVGRVNSDRLFFSHTDTRLVRFGAQIGQAVGVATAPTVLAQPAELAVPQRDYAIELGFETLFGGRWGRLQLTGYHDASNTHDGYEIAADYVHGWRHRRWYVEPSVGLSYKSRALNDYYWGVRADEASEALPAYRPGSGTNVRARLSASYRLTRHWAVALAAEYERLNLDAASSPLVADRDVHGFFAGVDYRF